MLQEFTQNIKNHARDMMRDMHTSIPGKIVTFDSDKCEASVLPFGKYKKPDGSMMDYPQINKVPVYVMQACGQTATVVFPIKKDDECLIFFAEQTLDTWRAASESRTDLRFDLTNAIVVVGLFAKPNPLVKEACADNAIIIEKDGERVRLKKGETYIRDTAGQSITLAPDAVTVVANNAVVKSSGDVTINAGGDIKIEAGGDMEIKAGGKFTLAASNASVNGAGQWITQSKVNSGTHTHSGGQSGQATTGPPVP